MILKSTAYVKVYSLCCKVLGVLSNASCHVSITDYSTIQGTLTTRKGPVRHLINLLILPPAQPYRAPTLHHSNFPLSRMPHKQNDTGWILWRLACALSSVHWRWPHLLWSDRSLCFSPLLNHIPGRGWSPLQVVYRPPAEGHLDHFQVISVIMSKAAINVYVQGFFGWTKFSNQLGQYSGAWRLDGIVSLCLALLETAQVCFKVDHFASLPLSTAWKFLFLHIFSSNWWWWCFFWGGGFVVLFCFHYSNGAETTHSFKF